MPGTKGEHNLDQNPISSIDSALRQCGLIPSNAHAKHTHTSRIDSTHRSNGPIKKKSFSFACRRNAIQQFVCVYA